MNYNKLTNVMILVLVIIGIYQTNTLWLRETSSNTLLDLLIQNTAFKQETADGDVLLATRYALGDGSGNYSVYYPDDVGQSTLLKEANGVLNEILGDRTIVFERKTADWQEILNAPVMVLQYDFLVDGGAYLSHYSNISNEELPEYFDYIVIEPSWRLGEMTTAYFVNSRTNESVSYMTKKSTTASDFYTKLVVDDTQLTYISTAQKTSGSILWRNLFLPQWAELPYTYTPLRELSVFGTEGAVNTVTLESVVKGFFNNFSVNWSSKEESGKFLFSDTNTVVNYTPKKQLLEYYDYTSYGNEKISTGLLEGYQISCSFMKNDKSLTTDVYLADIEKQNNETIYYFNYAVNNIPVILSNTMQEELKRPYAIAVTIQNDSVKNYSRYAVNYVEDFSQLEEINVQFIDALDNANKLYLTMVEDKVITDVSDLSLRYYGDSVGNMYLKWFVTLYEYLFVVDTDQL
ncbi:MAG: hypothetical protein R3Y53_08690 [Bacillota bacterium]